MHARSHHRPTLRTSWIRLATAASALLVFSGLASAIEDRADVDPNDALEPREKIAWKLTASQYRSSTDGQAHDVNLRGNTKDLTFWVGSYRDAQGFDQSRVGVEYAIDVPVGRITPSFQAATGGFMGWSLTWNGRQEKAQGFAPLVGFGRTNLRTYYNLNFDPNDSIMVGGSYVSKAVGTLMFFRIQDDRLKTGQRTHHLVWRKSLPEDRRLTVDLFARSGAQVAGGAVFRGKGVAATLDVGDYFVRLGYDAKANYTAGNITRLSLGYRF